VTFVFSRHANRWEIVADRGRLRLDNVPQLAFEQREIGRQKAIVAVRARAYMGSMIDGENAPGADAFKIAKAVDPVAVSRAYTASTSELARLQRIYATPPASHSIYLVLPISLSLLPLAWPLFAWRRARCRRRMNMCVACGYDLRATVQRCPECGFAITPQPSKLSLEPKHDRFVGPAPMG
jgi:hypothetical protein